MLRASMIITRIAAGRVMFIWSEQKFQQYRHILSATRTYFSALIEQCRAQARSAFTVLRAPNLTTQPHSFVRPKLLNRLETGHYYYAKIWTGRSLRPDR